MKDHENNQAREPESISSRDRDDVVSGVVPTPATGKQLLDATRPFAIEFPIKSWWAVVSTILLLGATLTLAALAPWWPFRLVVSVIGGLLLVRAFILFHDFMHGSLLRGSRLATPLFQFVGLMMLSPSKYWRYSHNFHHGNVGKPIKPGEDEALLVTSDLGSFPLMTTAAWRDASTWQRVRYRAVRNPLTLVFAYFTVFLFGLTVLPLLKDPRKYWDGALSILLHGMLIAVLWIFIGFTALFFAFLLPYGIAAMAGAYLFYAQHNYEGMHILKPHEWTYYRGAIESSSHMKLSRLMDWFTGNIGYHHIHHMNPLIPFYRLPEAMAAIPELQQAGSTTLRPQDILGCLRLNLWDPELGQLVAFRDA